MASFADSPQTYLPQGAPMLDINQLDQTLGYQDQQYNAGVQRVQNAYDSVAGLDVMRGIDKDYLQSKLNDLRTNIQSLAGGDFSNQSLVNQAAAMAPAISKDENVRNAVLSTQQIRAMLASQKRLQKAGKYTEIEKFNDTDAINQYLLNPNLEAVYTGGTEATEHIEGEKILADSIKEKEPDLIPHINNLGQLDYVVDKTKTRSPEQIRAIMESTIASNPRLAKYFQMVGKYQYQNYDANTMMHAIQQESSQKIEYYNQLIEAAEKSKIENPSKNEYYYQNVIKGLKQERDRWSGYADESGNVKPGYYNQLLEHLKEGNLDFVKGTLYLRSLEADMIRKYTKDDHEISIHTNETAKFALEQANKDRDYYLNVAKFNQQNRMDDWKMKMDMLDRQVDEKGNPVTKIIIPNDPSSGSYTAKDHDKRIAEVTATYNTSLGDLKKDWQNSNQAELKGKSAEQINALFQSYFNKQEKYYANNSEDIDGIYNDWRHQHDDIISKKKVLESVKKQAEKEAETAFNIDKDLPNSVTFTLAPSTPGGKFTEYTLDTKKNKEFVNTINSFYAKQTERTNALVQYQEDVRNGKIDPNKVKLNYNQYTLKDEILKEFKNNPYYNLLAAAVKSDSYPGHKTAHDALVKPQQEIRKKQISYADERFKEYGKNINYVGKSIVTDQDKKGLTSMVLSMDEESIKGQNQKLKLSDDKTENRGLTITDAYRDDNNKLHIRGRDANSNPFDLVPNAITSGYVPVDPYKSIKWQLEMNGKTSSEPDAALHTKNNKISYQLTKDPAGYRLWVIGTGGNPIRTKITNTDLGTIINSIDALSNVKSREEILATINK